MRRASWFRLIAGLAVLGIVVGVNLIFSAGLPTTQLDLTRGQIYTLTPATHRVLAGLKEPVTLDLFYSPQLGAALPAYGAYYDHVRQTLREYAALSHGMVRVKVYDPAPFSATEDKALAMGLQGVPIDTGGTKVYFGLAGTNLLDDTRDIAFFRPERARFLEYDITRLVYELSNPAKPVVGVLSSLPLEGDMREMMMSRGQAGQPYTVSLMLREADKVQPIQPDAQVIPKDVQVLLLVGPQHLSQATLYAIDQFVMRGGRLMAMVDPWSETKAAQQQAQRSEPHAQSGLPVLFKKWGIRFDPAHVVGELSGAFEVAAAPGGDSGAVTYPAWFSITKGINHDDPATADLHRIDVASPGALSKAPGAKIKFTPLLSTDGPSGLIPVNQVENPDPTRVLANFHQDGKTRVIAARVQGMLASAFSGPPPLAKGQKRPKDFPAYIAHTAKPADIVVVADTDLLADRFWVHKANFFGQHQIEPFADNGAFVADAIGTLAGSNALAGLRARGTTNHPFTVVENMKAEADARYRHTEQNLKAHLQAVQTKLADLRKGSGKADQAVLTPQQAAAIQEAENDVIGTRRQLRTVQFDLDRSVSALKTRLLLLDVVAIPVLLVLGAIGMALAGALRRRRISA